MAKFKDLEIGQEWAFSQQYQGYSEVPWGASKVVIVDTQPYYKFKLSRFDAPLYRPAKHGKRGMYIKVRFFEYPSDEFVYATHLFKKWDVYQELLQKQKDFHDNQHRIAEEAERFRQTNLIPKLRDIAEMLSELTKTPISRFQLEELQLPHAELLHELLTEKTYK